MSKTLDMGNAADMGREIRKARKAKPVRDSHFERWAHRVALNYTALTTDNMKQAQSDAKELIGYLRQAYRSGAARTDAGSKQP